MRLVTSILLTCLMPVAVSAENWSRFRGLNGTGIAPDTNIPAEWTQDDLSWSVDLPGSGHSSPVVWDDTVYVTSADAESGVFSIQAVSASDGETQWLREYPFEAMQIHGLNSHATSTPAVGESGLYVLQFTAESSVVIALDHDGNDLWTQDLGPSATMHGPSPSPMLYDQKLVFSLEQEENSRGLRSHWYALDAQTGKTVWRLDRESGISASSSTPSVYRLPDGKEWLIFTSEQHGITAVDPAIGKVVWEEESIMPMRVVASPVISGDLIIANCGKGGSISTLIALRPGTDAASDNQILYTSHEKLTPYLPTPIAVGDHLFTFSDRGIISCLEISTGKIVWSERLRHRIFGSPVQVQDRLYCITFKGEVLVIKADPKYFWQLGLNDLGEASKATPAISNGRMFLRTETRLNCISAPQ